MDSYFSKYHGVRIHVGDHLEITITTWGIPIVYKAQVTKFLTYPGYSNVETVRLKVYERNKLPTHIITCYNVIIFEENGFQFKILNNKKFDEIVDKKYKNLYI